MQAQSIFTAHPTTLEQINVLKAVVRALKVKFEVSENVETRYNPTFEAKIERSRSDYKKGKGTITSIDELNKLWK